MKIDRVYIAGYKNDLRWTQCCVASIRCWYPELPITLIKDESHGAYDTSEMETCWQVELFQGEGRVFGPGLAKLEPFFLPAGQRCLVLDSDIVFVGPVLGRLESCDEDVVVETYGVALHDLANLVYDLEKLQELDPAFSYPGFNFNSGQFVVATGLLKREDLMPLVSASEPPQLLYPDIFKWADQGLLNYLLPKLAAEGRFTLGRAPFMHWAGTLPSNQIRLWHLNQHSPHRAVVHFAGPKHVLFSANRNGHLLRHFEAAYYARLPHGRQRLIKDRLRRLRAVMAGRQSSSKPPGDS